MWFVTHVTRAQPSFVQQDDLITLTATAQTAILVTSCNCRGPRLHNIADADTILVCTKDYRVRLNLRSQCLKV